MEIVAGRARGLVLRSPDTTLVRPTLVRARTAFFDSLGSMDGVVFADMCAGSGAMGLEAASRGASRVVFFESAPSSIKIIRQNISKISKSCPDAVLELVPRSIIPFPGRLCGSSPDIIFADPPYSDSMRLLQALLSDAVFNEWGGRSCIYWELPDFQTPLLPPPDPWRISAIKDFASARFLLLERSFV